MTMFTPRQVLMGNKVYKLHIKHDAKKSSINLPPDHSIYQLKESIYSEFKVKPDQQILFCNGKLLDVSDYMTLKQAKIPNGSKINCIIKSKINLSYNVTQPMSVEDVEVDQTLQKLEQVVKKANDLELSVINLDKERRKLSNEEVPLFHEGDRAGDFKKLKIDCKKNGEQLMQLLESVDQMVFSEGQAEHRAKRKQVATLLNTVLDKNDKIIEKLSSAIKNVS